MSRTGITARALRIYERHGLITPQRTAAGWRCYGARELTRLNTIAVLKAAGLTLRQIRDVLSEKAPSLTQVLQFHVDAWKAKRAACERGLAVAETALRRVQLYQTLSIDELCRLLRDNELTPLQAELGELLKAMTPETLQRRLEFAATTPATEAFDEAVRTSVDAQLQSLLAQGAAPSSPEVQAVIGRHNELLTRFKIRELTLQRFTADDPADDDACRIKRRISRRMKQRPTDGAEWISKQWTSDPGLVKFFAAAEFESAQRRELDAIVLHVQRQMLAGDAPSTELLPLLRRLRDICAAYHLGDALVYAHWAALVRPAAEGITQDEDSKAWNFIAAALSD